MRTGILAVLLLVLSAIVGCETPTSAPTDGPRFNYINGPDDLFNVDRWESTFAVGISDPETGLRAVAGLPTVPSTHANCQSSNTGQFQLMPMQTIGGDDEPYVHIMNSDGINLHVYQLSTFAGFCRSTVYAQGVGHFASTDNDQTFSGERWNVWSYHLTGDVTVVSTGEVKHLNAFVLNRAHPDGGFQILTRKVELH